MCGGDQMNESVEFECKVIRPTYDSVDFKIYAVEVDLEKFKNIKKNNYGNVTILGNIHDLSSDIQYVVKATEGKSNYGYQYKIISIRRDKPTDMTSSKIFLEEILTENQANNLLNAYPHIIDMVIKNDLDNLDLNKVYGVKEKTFEKIKKKIVENFALIDLVDRFQGLISLKMLKKLYDKYQSTEVVVDKLTYAPYKCLVGLSRVGFKTADTILLKIDELSQEHIKDGKKPILKFKHNLKTSEDRMRACILYQLEENESAGNTKIIRTSLYRNCAHLTPECIEHFKNIVKSDDEHIFYNVKMGYVALKSTYDTELFIADKLADGLKYLNKWNIDCTKYKVNDNIELTEQQLSALHGICKNNILVIDGKAGSGKTQTVSSLTKMLKDHKIDFIMLAPTGKAANRMKNYSKIAAKTIHRGLGFIPPNGWIYNKNMPLPYKLVIVDEFSMVDVFLMKRLLDAIDFSKTKLLIVGDSDQIPSVGAGNILHDIIHSKMIPNVTLDKIFRYGEGGLMNIATECRLTKPFLQNNTKLQIFGKNKDYAFINCNKLELVENLTQMYQNVLLKKCKNPYEIVVLSAYNKGDFGTIEINKRLQKIGNPLSLTEEGVKVGEVTYYKNDLVMQFVNNYKAAVYNENYKNNFIEPDTTFIANGETGTIKEINHKHIIIGFDDCDIAYKRDEILNNIKLAYCISIHKGQGSEYNNVIIISPSAHTYMLNSNLLYVALTRTKKMCYHIGDSITVNRAVKKKENFDRNTFLKELLKNVDK